MARVRNHLRLAPAREALIHLGFERPMAFDAVQRFADAVSGSFKDQADMVQAAVSLDLRRAATASTSQSVCGKRLSSPDSKWVVQCRIDGFTVSRLSPYGDWAELRAETKKWWEVLVDVVGWQPLNKVAVRYINAIGLPLPIADFADYFTCAPEVPPELPQALSGFLYRVIVPDPATGSQATITQALESASAETGKVNVLLDIDVSRPVNGERDDIWSVLDQLREHKNLIFFSHLTERAVEMFE